jgi:hypothetical protein
MMTSRNDLKKVNSKSFELIRKRFSDSMKGSNNPMFGKSFPCSEEKKRNILSGLRGSIAFRECHTNEWRQKISLAQSRAIVIEDAQSTQIIGEWPNARVAAEFLGCTTANIKAAIRNQTFIGKKLVSLNFRKHRVRWKT